MDIRISWSFKNLQLNFESLIKTSPQTSKLCRRSSEYVYHIISVDYKAALKILKMKSRILF